MGSSRHRLGVALVIGGVFFCSAQTGQALAAQAPPTADPTAVGTTSPTQGAQTSGNKNGVDSNGKGTGPATGSTNMDPGSGLDPTKTPTEHDGNSTAPGSTHPTPGSSVPGNSKIGGSTDTSPSGSTAGGAKNGANGNDSSVSIGTTKHPSTGLQTGNVVSPEPTNTSTTGDNPNSAPKTTTNPQATPSYPVSGTPTSAQPSAAWSGDTTPRYDSSVPNALYQPPSPTTSRPAATHSTRPSTSTVTQSAPTTPATTSSPHSAAANTPPPAAAATVTPTPPKAAPTPTALGHVKHKPSFADQFSNLWVVLAVALGLAFVCVGGVLLHNERVESMIVADVFESRHAAV